MHKNLTFQQILDYCKFDYVPETLADKYERYAPQTATKLVDYHFLAEIYEHYEVPQAVCEYLEQGIQVIEQDSVLFPFTLFLVDVLGNVRNQCDSDFYTNMTPDCMETHKELYSFIILLACIKPSIERLKQRDVPAHYYESIPHQPLTIQLEKLINNNDAFVHDFQWFLNFYSCSIFLLDRFLFIPHKFEDSFKVYRHKQNNNIIALHGPDKRFRRDGQPDGVNEVYDTEYGFTTIWLEDAELLRANRINPLGFVEENPVTISKHEWELTLNNGDTLLALHVPAGAGYTVERLKSSMELAVEFYEKYFPDLAIKGFWSSSWLYDSRLSLVLNEDTNIVKVQRQFFTYPTGESDSMLRYELFGSRDANPLEEEIELKTSLQKEAVKYMKTGGRFNTLSMVVLKEEVKKIGSDPYITNVDRTEFLRVVDAHL